MKLNQRRATQSARRLYGAATVSVQVARQICDANGVSLYDVIRCARQRSVKVLAIERMFSPIRVRLPAFLKVLGELVSTDTGD